MFLDNSKWIKDIGGKNGPKCNQWINDYFLLKSKSEEFLVHPATTTDSEKKEAFLRM